MSKTIVFLLFVTTLFGRAAFAETCVMKNLHLVAKKFFISGAIGETNHYLADDYGTELEIVSDGVVFREIPEIFDRAFENGKKVDLEVTKSRSSAGACEVIVQKSEASPSSAIRVRKVPRQTMNLSDIASITLRK